MIKEIREKDHRIKELESIILGAVQNAGEYINSQAFIYEGLEWKKTDDPVTEADKLAEKLIKGSISHSDLIMNYYGEEEGIEDNGRNIDIFIDPIDGTKSYIRGEFLSSVSVAAAYDGELFFGCVYDFMRDIMYYADEDGAYLRRGKWNIEQKLPAVNVKFSKPSIAFGENTDYKKISMQLINPRRQVGSIALSMAQLAAGSYEGLVMKSKKECLESAYDVAAGYYIMKQAGIFIKDYDLEEYYYKKPSNGIIALKQEYRGLLKQ